MFSEWTSLLQDIDSEHANISVLNQFPSSVGKDVACAVVKNIAQNLTTGQKADVEQEHFCDRDVYWTMEVIGYGLSLPLTEMDTLRDCVTVYCDWLTALTTPRPGIPRVIVNGPNAFCIKIIQHLLNLFVPRPETDLIQRQAVHCHRVLRSLQIMAKDSRVLTKEIWHALLKFLLSANENLLSPPTNKNDVNDHLCERTVTVLFEIWLLACLRQFPSPPLWKTFRKMCINWRHHEVLVSQWHRLNHVLVSRLIKDLYGPNYPELHTDEDEVTQIISEMSSDCVAQTWFRFLHVLQNPVDLCHAEVIGQSPKFVLAASNSDPPINPSQHPCLDNLPVIFFKAMRGISIIVSAFLGIEQSVNDDNLMSHIGAVVTSGKTPSTEHTTPPSVRKTGRPFSAPVSHKVPRSITSSSTTTNLSTRTSTVVPSSIMTNAHFSSISPILAPNRPSCNSILHLFGSWLFEAALAKVQLHHSHAIQTDRRSSLIIDAPSAPMSEQSVDNTYESGRAEACATLCRIFSAHKTSEDILAVYLSRFYIVMYYGLQTGGEV